MENIGSLDAQIDFDLVLLDWLGHILIDFREGQSNKMQDSDDIEM